MEKIISIEEIEGLHLGNTGHNTEQAQLGFAQLVNAVFSGYGSYDGFKIKTSEHEYAILIENGQSCCEQWGYFSTNDDTEEFIGAALRDVELTDVALSTKKIEEEVGLYGFDCGGIQFVDFKTSKGVLQFAVYNAHNGYYGHPIIVAKDSEILLDSTL